MRLISWNVAARIKVLPRQAEFIAARSPHLLALQEVTPNSAPLWRDALHALGFGAICVRTGVSGQPLFRQRGVLIASRFPIAPIPSREIRPAWPEKALSVEISAPDARFDLHTVYTPTGVTDLQAKIDAINAACDALAAPDRPRILTGDFNAPKLETPDGRIATWAQTIRPDGSFRTSRGRLRPEQDAAERRLMHGLAARGVRDLYRSLNGYRAPGYSWTIKNRGRWVAPRRFDHAFASHHIQARRCTYNHAPRQSNLSDHAPLELDFQVLSSQ